MIGKVIIKNKRTWRTLWLIESKVFVPVFYKIETDWGENRQLLFCYHRAYGTEKSFYNTENYTFFYTKEKAIEWLKEKIQPDRKEVTVYEMDTELLEKIKTKYNV